MDATEQAGGKAIGFDKAYSERDAVKSWSDLNGAVVGIFFPKEKKLAIRLS